MEGRRTRRLPSKAAPETAMPTLAILVAGLLMVIVILWSANSIMNELKDVKNELKGMNSTLNSVENVTNTLKEYLSTGNETGINPEPEAINASNGNSNAGGFPTGSVTDVQQVVGGYEETADQTCTNSDGKLVVRLFGASYCPHCQWEKPVFEGVLSEFNETIDGKVYMLDTDLVPDDETALWQRYDPAGSVPTVIIGCKYYRIGSGESIGQDEEASAITQLICSQLGSNAPSFCG